MRLKRSTFVLALALVATLPAACTSLDDYAAPSSDPYVGAVLGQSDSSCDAGTGCSFLRRGFRTGTELVLTLDPDHLDSTPGMSRASRWLMVLQDIEFRASIAAIQLGVGDYLSREGLAASLAPSAKRFIIGRVGEIAGKVHRGRLQ